MYTPQQVARVIDHAVLKPNLTDRDVAAAADMCRRRGVGSLCVRPSEVPLAVVLLRDSATTVAAVVGFPPGGHCPATKSLEARLAVDDGAQELDMVMNIGKFLSGEPAYVQQDISGVVEVARARGVLVKVILETCNLTREQLAQACRLAQAAAANLVKTSTGFAEKGAAPEVIDVTFQTVGATMGVKASGGIRSRDIAVGHLRQGCQRLGVGCTEQVLDRGTSDGHDSSRRLSRLGRHPRRTGGAAGLRTARIAGPGRCLRRLRHRPEELEIGQPADHAAAGHGARVHRADRNGGARGARLRGRPACRHGHLGLVRTLPLLPTGLAKPVRRPGVHGFRLRRRHGRVRDDPGAGD